MRCDFLCSVNPRLCIDVDSNPTRIPTYGRVRLGATAPFHGEAYSNTRLRRKVPESPHAWVALGMRGTRKGAVAEKVGICIGIFVVTGGV